MRTRIAVLVVVLVVGVVAGCAIRLTTASEPTGKEPAHLITVSGTATVSTAPDEAVVSLGVHTQGADPDIAFGDNARKMAQVMKALTAAGIADQDVETTGIRLDQHTKNRDTPQETTFFVAEEQVDVTIHDITKIGDVIDQAVSAGASNVHDIRFQLSKPDEARQEALTQAVEGAKTKAEAMARTAGASLGEMISVREEANPNERNYERVSYGYVHGVAVAATPITPQQVQTQVIVTATWALEG